MVTIVSTATIVQGDKPDIATQQLQGGSVDNDNIVVAAGGITGDNIVAQDGGIAGSNDNIAFGGSSQTGNVIQFDDQGNIGSTVILGADPTGVSGTSVFFAIIGTSGSCPSANFFDRSPFFDTPSETDPNTLRDFNEAARFMLFGSTAIRAFASVLSTTSFTTIVTDKGDEFAASELIPTDIVVNGSFERDLASWSSTTGDASDIVSAVTAQPTGVGFDDSNPVSPTDGDKMLYLRKSQPDGELTFQTSITLESTPSSDLGIFSFEMCPSAISTARRINIFVQFLKDDVQVQAIKYKLAGFADPGIPTDIDGIDTIANVGPFTDDIFNSISSNILQDIDQASFTFDKVNIYIVVDINTSGSPLSLLFDEIGLTIDLLPEQLKRTASFAHILNNNPTSSGLPFTVSGSDNINVIDQTGPFFDETSPASGTTFNDPRDRAVEFHVKDGASALDQGNIDVWIDGLQVITAGTTITGTTWPIATKNVQSPSDIEYIFTRGADFDQQAVVTVSGELADFASPSSNQTITEYSFKMLGSGSLDATISGSTDAIPPVITPIEPIDAATDVSPNTDVIWSVFDSETGVDASTVKLFLNGALKFDGSTATDGSISQVGDSIAGFTYTYDPDGAFIFGETVTGTIQASDAQTGTPNSSQLSYEFTITSADTLDITNFFLADEESTPLTSGTELSVCVEDFTHGVNVSETSLTINGEVPSGLVTTTSGVGPDKVIFTVLMEPLVNFREDLEVLVKAENKFPGNFPVLKEQTFILRPGYDVTWFNREIDEPEIVFPFIKNIQVLAEVTNFAKNFGEGAEFFRFLIENETSADLGATLISNIEVADLSAALQSINPFFEYGKTIVLEIEADDLLGNQFRLTHTFIIEDKPS